MDNFCNLLVKSFAYESMFLRGELLFAHLVMAAIASLRSYRSLAKNT